MKHRYSTTILISLIGNTILAAICFLLGASELGILLGLLSFLGIYVYIAFKGEERYRDNPELDMVVK